MSERVEKEQSSTRTVSKCRQTNKKNWTTIDVVFVGWSTLLYVIIKHKQSNLANNQIIVINNSMTYITSNNRRLRHDDIWRWSVWEVCFHMGGGRSSYFWQFCHCWPFVLTMSWPTPLHWLLSTFCNIIYYVSYINELELDLQVGISGVYVCLYKWRWWWRRIFSKTTTNKQVNEVQRFALMSVVWIDLLKPDLIQWLLPWWYWWCDFTLNNSKKSTIWINYSTS